MKRENKYLVLKRSDISDLLNSEDRNSLFNIARKIMIERARLGKKTNKQYVVVAEDWPMYEDTWKAIEEYVDNRCPQCNSWEGLKFPREGGTYCEDCGWPDEDFGKDDVD